jgi:hypothetical protein
MKDQATMLGYRWIHSLSPKLGFYTYTWTRIVLWSTENGPEFRIESRSFPLPEDFPQRAFELCTGKNDRYSDFHLKIHTHLNTSSHVL